MPCAIHACTSVQRQWTHVEITQSLLLHLLQVVLYVLRLSLDLHFTHARAAILHWLRAHASKCTHGGVVRTFLCCLSYKKSSFLVTPTTRNSNAAVMRCTETTRDDINNGWRRLYIVHTRGKFVVCEWFRKFRLLFKNYRYTKALEQSISGWSLRTPSVKIALGNGHVEPYNERRRFTFRMCVRGKCLFCVYFVVNEFDCTFAHTSSLSAVISLRTGLL